MDKETTSNTDNLAEEDRDGLSLKFYSLEEVARALGITYRTALSYTKTRKLKAAKIGGRWKVTPENFKRFVNGE